MSVIKIGLVIGVVGALGYACGHYFGYPGVLVAVVIGFIGGQIIAEID